MRIGLMGLGRMGTAMAARLLETGYSVMVWNRSPDKAARLVEDGAVLAATPAALAAQSDIIIAILFDAEALSQVFHGEHGLLEADLTGRLVIEMSTVRPELERHLAEAVAARGGAFIDCPVGGTTGPARAGKLLGMAGGSEADFARAKPVLDHLCRRVEHIGPVGSGALMKLAINLPLSLSLQALGEAQAMVRHLGRDPAWLIDLFADSSGATTALKARPQAVAAALAGSEDGEVTFNLDGMRKDLRTMLDEAASHGVDLPLGRRALAVYDEASRQGHGGRDTTWVPSFWARTADVSPATKLTLDRADIIVEAALRRGFEFGLAPLTVAVLDAGGHLVAFRRQDGSGILRFDIAFGKAWGALGMGFGSRELLARSQGNPSFIAAISTASGGRVIPVPGGVLIKSASGDVLGAVGISGDSSDQDEACAAAGIAAAGFVAQIGA